MPAPRAGSSGSRSSRPNRAPPTASSSPTSSATSGLEKAAAETVASFRQLDQRTLASLKPLTISIITARPAIPRDSLAARMSGVDRPRELFRVLNHIAPGTPIAPGTKVKIVTDR